MARPRRSTPGRLQEVAAGVLLFCAVLAAYIPALNGGLLWDDDRHLTSPGLQSLHGLWRIWFETGATQQYYPLLHSAFWVEHRLWGDAMPGYHLTNVVLHALSACLLVAIVKYLRLPGAWLAGFLFALHPVCVEAVAWISEQKSTLSAVFYLASALCYLHFDHSQKVAILPGPGAVRSGLRARPSRRPYRRRSWWCSGGSVDGSRGNVTRGRCSVVRPERCGGFSPRT